MNYYFIIKFTFNLTFNNKNWPRTEFYHSSMNGRYFYGNTYSSVRNKHLQPENYYFFDANVCYWIITYNFIIKFTFNLAFNIKKWLRTEFYNSWTAISSIEIYIHPCGPNIYICNIYIYFFDTNVYYGILTYYFMIKFIFHLTFNNKNWLRMEFYNSWTVISSIEIYIHPCGSNIYNHKIFISSILSYIKE